jgi:hypothetical protein
MTEREPEPLLPPLRAIHERLTRNRREHRLLRTLHRLVIEAGEPIPPVGGSINADSVSREREEGANG